MIDNYIVQDLLDDLRTLYKEEADPVIKSTFLEYGLNLKQLIDDGNYSLIDYVDEDIYKQLSNYDSC